MDSIELLETTIGKFGNVCQVSVSTGDTYSGIYNGYGESTPENPLMLRLKLSKKEAERIGVPYLSEIGIRYDVITSISF
jgi:hypothetical protein